MNAPIRYFGGKGTMFNNIIEHFPPNDTYDTYIEPFGGSFSIGLKKDITPTEIYNDLDKNVYSLYKCISDKDLFDEFKFRCDLCIYSEDFRSECKDKLNQDIPLVDRAFYFFYVNRTSFNGLGGFSVNPLVRRSMSKSASDFLSAIDRLPELHQRLSKVIVMNTDGIELINKYSKSNILIYADPPYVQSTRTNVRYSVDMPDDEQQLFINAALKSKSKLIISGYDNKIYNQLEQSNFKKVCFNVNVNSGNYKPKSKTECIWFNY